MFLRLVVYWEEYCPFVNFIVKVLQLDPGRFCSLVLKLKFRFFFKKSFLQHPCIHPFTLLTHLEILANPQIFKYCFPLHYIWVI